MSSEELTFKTGDRLDIINDSVRLDFYPTSIVCVCVCVYGLHGISKMVLLSGFGEHAR